MPELQSTASPDAEDEVVPAGPSGQDEAADDAAAGESRPDIPSHLGTAIAAIFCFPITAIIAVWYASKVGDYVETGEYDRARAASRKVKLLSKVSVIIAPVWIIAVIVIAVVRSRMSGS